jgi:hypothetical protein
MKRAAGAAISRRFQGGSPPRAAIPARRALPRAPLHRLEKLPVAPRCGPRRRPAVPADAAQPLPRRLHLCGRIDDAIAAPTPSPRGLLVMISVEARIAGTLCGLAALVASLPAQQPERTNPAQPPGHRPADRGMATSHYIALDKLVGGTVRMRENAGDTGKPDAKGEVDDLLIGADGKVHWVVLDVGGFLGLGEKEVAVPISAFDCQPKDDDEATVTIAATEKQLKALPEFDLDAAEKSGLAAALRTAEAGWASSGAPVEGALKRDTDMEHKDAADRDAKTGAGESAGAPRAGSVAKPAMATAGEFVRASKIDDWKVRASDGAESKIEKVLVRVDRQPAIGYVVVDVDTEGAGATEFLVPFRALTRTVQGDDAVWTVSKSKAELAKAVQYRKPASGVLDAELARRADEFFGIHPGAGDMRPGSDPAKSGTGTHKGDGR